MSSRPGFVGGATVSSTATYLRQRSSDVEDVSLGTWSTAHPGEHSMNYKYDSEAKF